MKPKSFNRKSVLKECPDCSQQIPVACKACPCGYSFKKASSPITAEAESPESGKRRRTERVKRERPNYYNPLEFVNPVRRKRTTSASLSSGSEDTAKKRRGRPRGAINRAKDEDSNSTEKEEELFAGLSAERALQFSVILAEINRKMGTQTFRP